mmetsp:Transcript_5485/g.9968  ORF Transcript_5485/g.9968 Transcript_5485/m.9968 type:complete len:86 (-) Transcript_5485:47-304(-)
MSLLAVRNWPGCCVVVIEISRIHDVPMLVKHEGSCFNQLRFVRLPPPNIGGVLRDGLSGSHCKIPSNERFFKQKLEMASVKNISL